MAASASTRGSGTLTTAVWTSTWPLEKAAVVVSLRVKALKIVVLPALGKPMMPICIDISVLSD